MMIQTRSGRRALVKWTALIAALALMLIQPPAALAAPTVRVRLRTSITLGLVEGRNDTALLSATVKTSDGSTAPGVTWRSSAPTVVSVDASGKLTAHKRGTAIIRATAGGVTARCVATVRKLPVHALKLNRKKVVLYSGRSGFQLTSTPAPRNADDPSVTWSSSRSSVASVDRLTGSITPLKPGTATIQCRAADGTKTKSYCTVIVKPVIPTGLTLSQASLEVNVGATAALTATVSPADTTDQRVTWTSSNTSVATVSGGTVTGRRYGKATITAKTRSGCIRARCLVSVGYFTTTFRALVVGQDTYESGDLDAPATDVKLVNSMLVNSDFGGGKNVEVTLKENLTAADLRTELGAMSSWGVDSDDVTYFYYSGHGSEDDPGALVGVDGGTIPVDQVRQFLDVLPGTVVVILDSCYSGWFIRNKSTGAVTRVSINPDTVTNRVVSAFAQGAESASVTAKTSLAASTTAAGRYRILTACSSTESSYIIPSEMFQGASLFTYYLTTGGGVRAADWEADRLYADLNHNKIITLSEFYRYTRPRVSSNPALVRAGVRQSVRVWPADSAFPVLQRTP